jgi:ADP-ribose pyrophosphatase
MIQPWSLLQSAVIFTCRIFTLKKDSYRSPRTGKVHDFFVLDSPDWVNVIPVTPENEVILVRQYRLGTNQFSLEIPGGMLDPGESPAEAATRELLEETGYAGDAPRQIGAVHPNPAINTNRCHTYLVRNAASRTQPRQDSTEDIEVQKVPLAQIPDLIREGRITHALVVAAFYYFFAEGRGGFRKTGKPGEGE